MESLKVDLVKELEDPNFNEKYPSIGELKRAEFVQAVKNIKTSTDLAFF